jgi:hypothetical protein
MRDLGSGIMDQRYRIINNHDRGSGINKINMRVAKKSTYYSTTIFKKGAYISYHLLEGSVTFIIKQILLLILCDFIVIEDIFKDRLITRQHRKMLFCINNLQRSPSNPLLSFDINIVLVLGVEMSLK